jgi:hypothetical protein
MLCDRTGKGEINTNTEIKQVKANKYGFNAADSMSGIYIFG